MILLSAVAARLLLTLIIVILCCLVVISLVVIHISMRLSAPIRETCNQSTKIVNNIGGDLFEGVHVKGQPKGTRPPWGSSNNPIASLFFNAPGEVSHDNRISVCMTTPCLCA